MHAYHAASLAFWRDHRADYAGGLWTAVRHAFIWARFDTGLVRTLFEHPQPLRPFSSWRQVLEYDVRLAQPRWLLPLSLFRIDLCLAIGAAARPIIRTRNLPRKGLGGGTLIWDPGICGDFSR